MENRRVLLADGQDVMRWGLRFALEAAPGFNVCGEAEDGEAMIAAFRDLHPCLLVLDVDLPGLNALEAARIVLAERPQTGILFHVCCCTPRQMREFMATKARGVIARSAPATVFLTALEKISAGESYFHETARPKFPRKRSSLESRLYALRVLTPREIEVVTRLAEGYSNREVAQLLGISIKTAETHRARIVRKLQFTSLADLVRFAINNSLVAP